MKHQKQLKLGLFNQNLSRINVHLWEKKNNIEHLLTMVDILNIHLQTALNIPVSDQGSDAHVDPTTNRNQTSKHSQTHTFLFNCKALALRRKLFTSF